MKTTQPKEITTNQDQRLYIIDTGAGISCHGFDVVERLISHLEKEGLKVAPPLLKPWGVVDPCAPVGTVERYAYYRALCNEGNARNTQSGWKSTASLTPELIGKEGKRVEIVHQWESGNKETVRFHVGKSSGWQPCHLQLHNRASRGGGAVCLGKILSVKIIS